MVPSDFVFWEDENIRSRYRLRKRFDTKRSAEPDVVSESSPAVTYMLLQTSHLRLARFLRISGKSKFRYPGRFNKLLGLSCAVFFINFFEFI